VRRDCQVRKRSFSVASRTSRAAMPVRLAAAQRFFQSTRDRLGMALAALAPERKLEQLAQGLLTLPRVELAMKRRGDAEAERGQGGGERSTDPVSRSAHFANVRSRRVWRPAGRPATVLDVIPVPACETAGRADRRGDRAA